MKIAIISDIHANLEALKSTLEEAKKVNNYQLVCDMEMSQNDELKSYEVKVEYLKKDEPIEYLYKSKGKHMIELIEKLTKEDCQKIYDDYNFACLKEVIE